MLVVWRGMSLRVRPMVSKVLRPMRKVSKRDHHGGEVHLGVLDDPVVGAGGGGDVAVEAHGAAVTTSRMGWLPSRRLYALLAPNPGDIEDNRRDTASRCSSE